MKLQILTVTATLLFLVLSPLNQASEEFEQALKEPVYFMTTTVKPWGYRNKAGEQAGLLVRFIDELALEAQRPYRNQLQPYPRVIHALRSGAADMAVLFDSPKAGDIGYRVGEVVGVDVLLVAQRGTPSVNSLSELKGWRVGFIRGSKYTPAFDSADHFSRIPMNSMQQGLAMLLAGRIDAMASTDQTFFYAMEELALEPDRVQRLLLLGKTSAGLYFSKQSTKQHLIPYYRAALERLESSGQLAKIFLRQGLGSLASPSL